MNLDIDLRGDAKIEDLRHQIGGLEIKLHIREGDRQLAPQLLDVVRGRRMALLQLQQDLAIIDADRGPVGERQIIDALGQTDIVEDQGEVSVGD